MIVLRRALLTFVAVIAVCGVARAQPPYQAPPVSGAESLPYPPRQPTAPVAPKTVSTPAGWVNGPAQAEPTPLTDQELVAPYYVPKDGVPEKFTGTEVICRVGGTEVILASDVMPGVEETIQRALAAKQIQESQVVQLRYQLMYQRLQQFIDTKVLLIQARREIPKENLEKIRGKVKEIYEKEQIPKLIDGEKIKSRAELITKMREAGTSLEDQERQFFERSIAAQYVHKQVGEEKEITHAAMLTYYREHAKDYETEPRARWEHIMVRYANYPSKAEAYAKIAAWGNEVFSGVPLAEVAKKHSDDLSSEEGGLHDWTTQGALASEVLDQATFKLPLNQLSPILEDDRGLHIVRVVERQALTRKPFDEVQAEIKKKLKSNGEGEAVNAYVAELRKKAKVWTIFDDLVLQAENAKGTAQR